MSENCRLDLEWAGRLRHVQFGRVRGMSTRRGTAVFLSDILDEAFERMREKQESSPNTRAASGGEVTDVLAVSALVVHDFMQRKRTAEYEFSWDAALASTGGVRMQACHSVLGGFTQHSSQTSKPTTSHSHTFYHTAVPAQPAMQPAGEQRRGRGGLGPPRVLEGEAIARGPLQPLRIGRGRFASL